MAVLFLTSSPTGPLDGARRVEGFDYMNNLKENIRTYWKENSKCLMIAAAPSEHARNDEMTAFFEEVLNIEELSYECFDLWDDRTMLSREALQAYDVIYLSGGHVPTERAFFEKIGLKEKLKGFDGIIMGISAGTMNSAEIVYAQPEEPGEAVDPDYVRFFPGLGLTKWNVLPHYQCLKDGYLDGQKIYEDIAAGDSHGKEFLILPDGSYVISHDGIDELFGEAWIMKDGQQFKINDNDKRLIIS